MFKKAIYLLVGVMFTSSAWSVPAPNEPFPHSSKEALDRLMAGNKRYVKEMLEHPNRSQGRREVLTEIHEPFAVIIGCSDARVSPIIVFDQGLGDLFEVRVAGNVVGPIEIASAEFGAFALGASLIFVLGHENCAAVNAVITNNAKEIQPIADQIETALKLYSNGTPKNLENAIKANITGVVQQLRSNEVIAKLIANKKVEIVGGYYNLTTGEVEICCDLPKR